jgi:UDPglucose--hexose-1-phosphate uridylyltransferase
VVPNLYPVTDTHEVIIHSPDHEKDLEDLSLEQVTKVMRVYRDRFRAHESAGQVMIFCNHGFHAGASLAHPHSQLVVVPKQINLDALEREPIANVVEENKFFVTYCPDFSQWPYEAWVAPKEKTGLFGETPDDQLGDLASVLQKALLRIRGVYKKGLVKQIMGDTFVYNFYVYHGTNWFIRIVPRLIHRAGFELGTGLNVNIADPTEAAKSLEQVLLK